MAFEHDSEDIKDLRETLQSYERKARVYIDFTDDLSKCDWDTVRTELRKAQSVAVDREEKGRPTLKNPNPLRAMRWAWRHLGAAESILSPGLAAFPDWLAPIHGGLAVIFSLARHSEMNRLKLMTAFETIPNIVEMAQNKAANFPLEGGNPKAIRLHKEIAEFQQTLLKTIPALIGRLAPGTWVGRFKSPFGSFNIDRLLDVVKAQAETVRVCAEGMMEEMILESHQRGKSIEMQLDEVIRQNRTILMSIDAAHGKTHVLQFLLDGLNPSTLRWAKGLPARSRPPTEFDELSRRGSAMTVYTYTSSELLVALDVHHLSAGHDRSHVIQRGNSSLEPASIDRVATVIKARQVKELLLAPPECGGSAVAIDGHCDLTQMGQVAPTSVVVALVAQILQNNMDVARVRRGSGTFGHGNNGNDGGGGGGRAGSSSDANSGRSIILTFFCSLHTSSGDELRGPQGMMRSLAAQLVLALSQDQWMLTHDEPIALPFELSLPPPESPHPPDLQYSPQRMQRRRSEPDEFGCFGDDENMGWDDSASTLPGGRATQKSASMSLDKSCRLFRRLLQFVPAGVPVFCLVDGISSFERKLGWGGNDIDEDGEDDDPMCEDDDFNGAFADDKDDDDDLAALSQPYPPLRRSSQPATSPPLPPPPQQPSSALADYNTVMETFRSCVLGSTSPYGGPNDIDMEDADFGGSTIAGAAPYRSDSGTSVSGATTEGGGGLGASGSFRLLLTSATASQWLPEQLVPWDKRVSLRGRGSVGGDALTFMKALA